MTTITIEELEARVREVIDALAQGGEPVAVTRDGVAIAEIIPMAAAHQGATVNPRWSEEERAAYWAEWEALSKEVAKTWPKGVSAVDAIREDRSRLDRIGTDGPDR